MRTAWRSLAIAGLLASLQVVATAQTIYRCGNEYTRVPCPQGRTIDDDARTEAQRVEATRLAADEKRQGDEMERARLRREAALKPAMASALSSAPAHGVKAASPLDKRLAKKRAARPKAGKIENGTSTPKKR